MSNFQNLVVEKVVVVAVKMEDLVEDLVAKEPLVSLVEMVAETEAEAINQMVVVAETVVHQVGQIDIQHQIRVQVAAAMMEGAVTVAVMVVGKEVVAVVEGMEVAKGEVKEVVKEVDAVEGMEVAMEVEKEVEKEAEKVVVKGVEMVGAVMAAEKAVVMVAVMAAVVMVAVMVAVMAAAEMKEADIYMGKIC